MFSKKSKYIVSSPFAVWIVGFIVLPICFVLYYAFVNESGAFTFENIKNVFTNAYSLKSIWLTVKLSF